MRLSPYASKRRQLSCVDLSEREQEVLQLVARGLDNRTIASHLCIQVGTVKNHVNQILRKLDVHSRAEAALVAPHFAIIAVGEQRTFTHSPTNRNER